MVRDLKHKKTNYYVVRDFRDTLYRRPECLSRPDHLHFLRLQGKVWSYASAQFRQLLVNTESS